MKNLNFVLAIQIAYPQLWFACHVEHRTRGSTSGTQLTDRESGILAHISANGDDGCSVSSLAKHLGIGKPALSQHLKRLRSVGLVTASVDIDDARRQTIALTPKGQLAVSASSPLDSERLERLLSFVPENELSSAVRGLETLAAAARQLQSQSQGR